MTPRPFADEDEAGEPIDLLMRYCDAHEWPHETISEDELVATVQGSWAAYEMRGVWRDEDQVLQLLMMPEIKVLDDQRVAIHETLSLINEQLWMGHFELWSSSGMLLYRHATLADGDGLSFAAIETLVQTAIEECERFYPVFQFVLWGGKTPSEAIAAALIETQGEA